ncbi:MAG: 16S rRNA (guanine(527)-N(7))-methyltransferase RsmG [Pseudomonadota bacterium]
MADSANTENAEFRRTLLDGARELGVALDDRAVQRLLCYLNVLLRWNRAFNLTAIRQPSRIITEHLLDAISIAGHVHGERIIDVGTGAGLPGLILAALAPERPTVLLDANGKKIRFLREAVRTLDLARVTVHHGRSEDYRPDTAFDTVVCRAFAPLPRLIDVAAHLRSDNGILLAQKGLYPEDEVAALDDRWRVEHAAVHVPGLAKTRHVLTLRPGPTP